MSEDLIKRRQLLKEKLEGKSTENLSSPSLKQTKPKTNPTRLHIPTIFQLNKSTENVSNPPKLSSQSVNISKSSGNIHKDSSLKLTNFEESTFKAPTKPPRKLSTPFCTKIDDAKSTEDLTKSSQNESKLRFSQSFNVTKSTENIAFANYGDLEKKERKISRTYSERKFSISSEDQEEQEVKMNTSPVIVSSIKKKNAEETNIIQNPSTSTTEEGLVMLRKKLSDLRTSKFSKLSSDSLPTLSFNFTDQNVSPPPVLSPDDTPILRKLEKHPNLKRSGSRVGFIVREEMLQQKEENYNNDEDSLYDNLQLKHTPVVKEKQNNDADNNDKLNNNTDIVDKLYDNIKLKNTPLEEPFDKLGEDYSRNKEMCEETKKIDEVLLTKEQESNEEIEKDNSLYDKFDNIMQCDEEEIKKELHMKYNNLMINEVLYENMEVVRANNYYSRKFLLGPVYKKPLPTKRSGYN